MLVDVRTVSVMQQSTRGADHSAPGGVLVEKCRPLRTCEVCTQFSLQVAHNEPLALTEAMLIPDYPLLAL
eukprot:4978534-Amphidinium_carterae.1